MITITDKAKQMIKHLSDAEAIGHYSIRLRVIGGGCAGFSYDMYFEDKPGELDEIFEFDEVKIVSDPLSLQYVENVEIDYVDSPLGGGFKFNNPSATGSCGCGSSFSV
jgi:iron-sulfur cluster insertion protein